MPPVWGERHRDRQARDAAADQAVAALYRAHYQSLVRVAALLVSDTATAEEVVQAAFVSLHHARRQLGDEDRALAYLRRAVIRGTRSRGTAPADPSRLWAGPPPGGWPDPSSRESVLAALDALPARQREALVLRYYAEWPEAQIAAAMDISGRAVMNHIERGLSTLRAGQALD
jgi:DNA-directed RNA polymerase specialized sigma24 family protein